MRWHAAAFALFVGAGIAFAQGAEGEKLVTVHDGGKAVRAQVLDAWQIADGRVAHWLQAVDTGEFITIADVLAFENVGVTPVRGVTKRIFWWGAGRRVPPEGSPIPPRFLASPGLQAPPPPRPLNVPTRDDVARMITDGSRSPAEITAAKIKIDEGQALARQAAVRYLGTIDCHYYPEAEAGIIAALRCDRIESVRFEAAVALGTCRGVSMRTLEALNIVALGLETDGNPAESSETVRLAARHSLMLLTKTPRPPWRWPMKQRQQRPVAGCRLPCKIRRVTTPPRSWLRPRQTSIRANVHLRSRSAPRPRRHPNRRARCTTS